MFKDRVAEAKAAAKFAQVMRRDGAGRPTSIMVPGHGGRRYYIIIRRTNGKLSTECLVGDIQGEKHCPGSLRKVCYHQMAAVVAIAAESSLQVYFFETYKEAKNFSNLGGKVNSLTGWTSKDVVWMVIK